MQSHKKHEQTLAALAHFTSYGKNNSLEWKSSKMHLVVLQFQAFIDKEEQL